MQGDGCAPSRDRGFERRGADREVELVARGAPVSITVGNGSEFVSKAMKTWAYQHRIDLDFIRPNRPVENGYIESFNATLRDESLNVQV